MKPWKPELSNYEDAAALSNLALVDKESLTIKAELEDQLKQIKVRLKLLDIKLEENGQRKNALRTKLGALRQDNDISIRMCEDQINDILHYIEVYQLDATQCSILMRKLKEARRKKRSHQDSNVLINAAYYDMNSKCSVEGHRNSYDAHFARISGDRVYTPRQDSLEALLYPELNAEVTNLLEQEVPATNET